MTAASVCSVSQHPLRLITATALFDGHDAAINMIRRLLQAQGVEVIHLGHNRSVQDIVQAALDEDVQGICVSSYQGGHLEFFSYMLRALAEAGAAHIRLFGGGGGVIVESEVAQLHAMGVERIYTPEDGRQMGLEAMMLDLITRCRRASSQAQPALDGQRLRHGPRAERWSELARLITQIENHGSQGLSSAMRSALERPRTTPVIGITGTGGAGKSSLVDELVLRLRLDQGDRLHLAVLSMDPTQRKTGGALLGDRIRMNALYPATDGSRRVFMRSLATRNPDHELSPALPLVLQAVDQAGFDVVIVETSGIGQGNAAITSHVDHSLYVMTPEYGAASQLEKIEMLDFAELIAINKFDRRGADDAWREVCKQFMRNRRRFDEPWERAPVYGTQASRFNDDGVTALYHGLKQLLDERCGLSLPPGALARPAHKVPSRLKPMIQPERERYLSDIAQAVRAYKRQSEQDVALELAASAAESASAWVDPAAAAQLQQHAAASRSGQSPSAHQAQQRWAGYAAAAVATSRTLSGLDIPTVAAPRYASSADLLRFLLLENLPGYFPYTAGVFPFKRSEEEPTRMFAGEGDAERTNRRFHLLSQGMPAKRLSTAFDSVTLYGYDPHIRPDIYGKVGNSGVSIATLDDVKALYQGFDLCHPNTSVSMTINGPAAIVLAMFLNAAIDQQVDVFSAEHQRQPNTEEYEHIKKNVFTRIRGTVQADILKEDQGQNTCIFSREFSLAVMGDVQQFFIDNHIRNLYSVSISGYHIAEAGANPISQLAFTLANGFTYAEVYRSRGMAVDDFATNFSFFFSNGMEPEYTVIGRVARRIWAIAMRDVYGASEKSQRLKYHIQTSGRSLHAQEVDFNDIRTTLQALIAIYDHCNSLHTNAYDEAITTPTAESVRRAMAIQLIINREWGLAKNQNPNQGSFILEQLTDMVEEAVLDEFEKINARGGVLGAMETGYQRGKIQDESLDYEKRKHDGSYPIVGVNTFVKPGTGMSQVPELARSTDDEKDRQIQRLAQFHQRHHQHSAIALQQLKTAALAGDNLFAVLMDVVRVCSLGQITQALFEVGGQYRRNV